MPTRLEDEIKKQLDESAPVDVDEGGQVIPSDRTITGADGTPINPVTGEATTRLKPQRWFAWYNDNPHRLLSEKKAMNIRFPHFQLVESPRGMTWTGHLRPKEAGTYRVALIYPHNFPYSPPNVWVISPKIDSPKHQFPDGSLCLMHPSDGTWQTNTTAVTLIAMTSTWLWCYGYHQRHCGCSKVPCDYWPGKEA